jgi:hypothetical protein
MKCRKLLTLLLASAMLSVAARPGIGGEARDDRSLKAMECRNEAAARFINDFVLVGAQQRVEGTEIVIQSFRSDHPERFESYVMECAKRELAK